MLAKILHDPIWSLTEDESKQFGSSLESLIVFYGLDNTSQEAILWGQLIVCAGTIYGPRIVHTMMRPKETANASTE